MDLGKFLFHAGLINKAEYQKILGKTLPHLEHDSDGFALSRLDKGSHLDTIRAYPFGEEMRKDTILVKAVLERSGLTVDDLIDEWRHWHLANLEPIADYNLDSQFGKQLYNNQAEKKLVAQFIANSDNGIIKDGDIVVIPEGSSVFYAGLAIAAYRKNVTILTTNVALSREYHENPAFTSKVKMHVIGGEIPTATRDKGGIITPHYGFGGEECKKLIVETIKTNPGATVVLSSFNGMLPSHGPFAPDGLAAQTRRKMLEAAFEQQVREVVFVGDYRKHLADNARNYGIPIFATDLWRKAVADNFLRLTLATCPPEPLRQFFSENHYYDFENEQRRTLCFTERQIGDRVCKQYNEAVVEFDEKFRNGGFHHRCHEAVGLNPEYQPPLVARKTPAAV